MELLEEVRLGMMLTLKLQSNDIVHIRVCLCIKACTIVACDETQR